jgi:hypothetical protein
MNLNRLNSTAYTLKVWLTSVVLSPAVIMLNGMLSHSVEDINMYLVIVLIGAICSSISFLIFYVAVLLVSDHMDNLVQAKLLLLVIAILLTIIPFWVIGGYHIGLKDLKLILPYTLTIAAGIWIYRLKLVTSYD